VASLPVHSAALDGELVYLSDDGFPDFEALQQATRSSDARVRLYYQVFDLLCVNSEDLTGRPLIERKARLCELLTRAKSSRLRYVAHVEHDGAAFFGAVDALGLEGIVCKRATSIYQPGVRASSWVKVKCFRTQRFAIVGYTVADGQLESLVVAGEHNGALHYAGRVEWGVPRRDPGLLTALRSIEECTATVINASCSAAIRWLEPRLAADVRALAWRPGRSLRHAVLRGVSVATGQLSPKG
jgi:bifunctional non-homologous end joining protein LigD